MDTKAFVKEHKKLVRVLKEGSKAEQKKEGKEQASEMKEMMKKKKSWKLSDTGAMKG